MAIPLHSINVLDGSTPRAEIDRLSLLFLSAVATPSATTSITVLGAITAGTAFTSLPTIALTAGTGSGGTVVATSLKVVSATVVFGGTSGYVTSDTITLSNGVVLTATASGGVCTTATILTAGAFLGPAPNPQTLSTNPVSQTATSGSGVGTTTWTLVYGLGTAVITNSGTYTVVPTGMTVTGGGGSGASLAAPTLGGAGNPVTVAVSVNLPLPHWITLFPNVVGDVFALNRSNTGFSVSLAPALAGTTLAPALVDVMVFG